MTGSSSTSEAQAGGRARRLAGWAVLAGGLIGLLLSIALGEVGRRTLFDAWQRAAPRAVSPDRVAVVLIDPVSMKRYGSWPWPRLLMADLTEGIARQNPKVIGFDVIFAESDPFAPAKLTELYPQLSPAAAAQIRELPDLDSIFGRTIGLAPVLLARLGVDTEGGDPEGVFLDPEVAGTPPAGTARYPQVLGSVGTLDDAALTRGLINGDPDADGIVRRVPLTPIVGKRAMPGFAVELARIAAGAEQLAWRGDGLHLGKRVLPADRDGTLAFRMGPLPKSAIVLAAEVLDGQIAPNALTGKVVLVGLGGDGTADLVSTPVEREIPGATVQAQAIDAILAGDWLARPAALAWSEWGLALVLVLLVLFAGGTRRYWLLAVAGVIAAGLWLGSFAAFSGANLLFDPLRPTTIGLSAAIAMWITLYMLARAERARLAAALVEQRVAAAEQEGELNAARRIQLGMVPSPERLSGLDPRAEIGAVLRPAKSVGGDFYDALMLDANRLLFVIGDVTGKGVPAALYMALSKALAKSVLGRSGDDLGEAVAALNRDLMNEADEEMGVTILAGVLDCTNGALVMVSAGHEHPLVVRAGGAIETLALRGGPPFCVVDFPYPEERATLAPDDTLVLITDGATEAQNAGHALLGLDGVIAALRGEGEMPATTRAADLADRVRAFEGETEPSDDLTIVALRWRGA